MLNGWRTSTSLSVFSNCTGLHLYRGSFVSSFRKLESFGGFIFLFYFAGWVIIEIFHVSTVFIHLGTIGFGDLVPGQKSEEVSLCACSAYILTGMALVAMCFSLVQEEVMNLFRLIGTSCSRNHHHHHQQQSEKAMDDSMSVVNSWQRPKVEGAAPPINTPPLLRKIPPILQHNSLPRKINNFQRNTPIRRSAVAGSEPLVEYFVPRSMSEFDLSVAVGDAPVRMPAPPIRKTREKQVTFEDEMKMHHDVFMWQKG